MRRLGVLSPEKLRTTQGVGQGPLGGSAHGNQQEGMWWLRPRELGIGLLGIRTKAVRLGDPVFYGGARESHSEK